MKFHKTKVYVITEQFGDVPTGHFVIEYNGEPPLQRFFADKGRPDKPSFIIFDPDWYHWGSYSQYMGHRSDFAYHPCTVSPNWEIISNSPYGAV